MERSNFRGRRGVGEGGKLQVSRDGRVLDADRVRADLLRKALLVRGNGHRTQTDHCAGRRVGRVKGLTVVVREGPQKEGGGDSSFV